MATAFNPSLKAHELPRETLVELWQRTSEAHEHLRRLWHAVVTEEHSSAVADAIALEGWPLLRHGATSKDLFFDDLRFIVAATELQPDMLTVAKREQAETPAELCEARGWFEPLISVSRLFAKRSKPPPARPKWTGSPGRLRGLARGRGIELGFVVLLKAWQASQSTKVCEIDVVSFEDKLRKDFDTKTLALLWNYAALAYMLATDRWFTGVRNRYGNEVAQRLEKRVWIDRGAAEYDLQIGREAMAVEGNDVEALLRSFQLAPGEVGILDVELDLQSSTRGTITHHRCPALDRFEHFDDDRLRHCCDICIAAMPISGEMLDPTIRCRPVKLPPRRDANDIACKWEYWLEG